jgi:hypothetical protein
MEDRTSILKTEFVNVKDAISKIAEIKNTIKRKLVFLKEIHGDLIKDNGSKKIFLICLESFHFQYKVMTFDTANMHRNFLLLTNRAYCDYYNMYNLLHKLFEEEYKIDIPTTKKHPVYNDLEPFSEYKLEDLYLVYENAFELLTCLIGRLRENENIVKKYKSKSQSGIRIDNFINTLEYDNKILGDRIELYINYFDFFQKTQIKYFTKLLEKITALQEEIDTDIQLRETPWDKKPVTEDDTLTQTSEDCAVAQWESDSRESE